MTYVIDSTHDSRLNSWIDSANDQENPFPVQNLPFCRFQPVTSGPASEVTPRLGVGIGDQVLDLRAVAMAGLLPESLRTAASHSDLSLILQLALPLRRELRLALSELLTNSQSGLAANTALRRSALISQNQVHYTLPHTIGNYSDFYASVYHATNVGSMFRPDNPLLPNYKHIPIGYHGRASSIVVSDTGVVRPRGQLPPATDGAIPTFGPCQNLDYELELGFVIGRGNALGNPIAIADAETHLFGVTLLNDWSARDLQRWEYQPLGPFLAKSFATTIAPWIVTMEALAPFRIPAWRRPEGDPPPLPYLQDRQNSACGGMAIDLSVSLTTAAMRDAGISPLDLSHSRFDAMYWTPGQMLTHHASNGCNLQTGDILGSGTISGTDRSSRGCLLELTWDGEFGKPVPGSQRTPIALPTGEKRIFLADGDEVTLSAYSRNADYRTIGFGTCRGRILPAGV